MKKYFPIDSRMSFDDFESAIERICYMLSTAKMDKETSRHFESVLTEKQKHALRLVYKHDNSIKETAHCLGVSKSSVEKLIKRALTNLGKELINIILNVRRCQ